MPFWLWLLPLALCTLWVWGEVLWGWLQRRQVEEVRAWRQRVDARAETPPCTLCGSQTHTYREHVRIPQSELAQRAVPRSLTAIMEEVRRVCGPHLNGVDPLADRKEEGDEDTT